jgi:SPFH domain / Band 7 family
MFLYSVPGPNEALLITGMGAKVDNTKAAAAASDSKAPAVKETQDFKVGGDRASIVNAGRRFLGKSDEEMNETIKEMAHGHLRSIVAGLSVEELITGRDSLTEQVREATAVEMQKLGLHIEEAQALAAEARKESEVRQARAQAETEKARAEADVQHLGHLHRRAGGRRRVASQAARATATIGAVAVSSCQCSPRSGLWSRRPSAMPQISSSPVAASAYGIDSPGRGSSRQASPSQR